MDDPRFTSKSHSHIMQRLMICLSSIDISMASARKRFFLLLLLGLIQGDQPEKPRKYTLGCLDYRTSCPLVQTRHHAICIYLKPKSIGFCFLLRFHCTLFFVLLVLLEQNNKTIRDQKKFFNISENSERILHNPLN